MLVSEWKANYQTVELKYIGVELIVVQTTNGLKAKDAQFLWQRITATSAKSEANRAIYKPMSYI